MAPIKIVFGDHCATPPVFVAGSFTEWKAVEIEVQESEEGHIYEKIFDLAPGTYQYKFRLGPGDWWVCDSKSPRTCDDAGNENNEIVVAAESVQVPSSVPTAAVTSELNETLTAQATTVPKSADENVGAQYYREVLDTKPVSKTDNKPSLPVGLEKAEKPVTEEKPTPKSNGIEAETPVSSKVTNTVEKPSVAEEKPTLPENEKASPAPVSAPEQATKHSKSKESSVSSLPPKEKVSGKQQDKPEKLGWFTRIFLCGSSRQTMLAAVVIVITPIFAAYCIQR